MAPPAKPARSTALLRIVRTMIDIGRQRLAAIRSQPGPQETRAIAIAFGTFNVALIVARILRGLRIAAALEVRAIANAPHIDAPPPPRVAAARPLRQRMQPKRPDAHDDAALLARVPTDREIAEMVRRRPIGTVLVDICADLGIGTGHPLWQELRVFIIDHGGQPEPVMDCTFQRLIAARRDSEKFLAPDFVFHPEPRHIYGTTGPPPVSMAA